MRRIFCAFIRRITGALQLWLWNAYARLRNYETCHICDDTRGGAIGNGQWIDGALMCDYCHSDYKEKKA